MLSLEATFETDSQLKQIKCLSINIECETDFDCPLKGLLKILMLTSKVGMSFNL